MRLVWQWIELERRLPANWADARLVVTVGERDGEQAAALLGGANPLRRGGTISLFVSRAGPLTPDALRRALLRLDRKQIDGALELVASTEADAEAAVEPVRASLAETWQAEIDALPDDWSNILAQLALRSSDHLERAALLVAPVNPTRVGKTLALRFRAAHRAGYGASAVMVRRCFERLDEEGIPGETTILNVLCDTHNVATQGPVWRVDGRAV
jgi:hypothetical protein